MSKSMAIDAIMKIFLMIAVIVVGVSFLLRAFSIDIFGNLSKQLGTLESPADGKALHVKLNPETGDNQVYEFHVTDGTNNPNPSESKNLYLDTSPYVLSEKAEDFASPVAGTNLGVRTSLFSLANAPSNGCLLFTTRANIGKLGNVADKGRIYVVKDGTTIQDGCSSLNDCIVKSGGIVEKDCNVVECTSTGNRLTRDLATSCRGTACSKIADCGQNGDCKSSVAFNPKTCTPNYQCSDYKNYIYTETADQCSKNIIAYPDQVCDIKDEVLNKQLSDISNFKESCENQHNGNTDPKCNLLAKDTRTVEIQFGALCANQKWNVCSQKLLDAQNQPFTDNGVNCKKKGNSYVWDGTWKQTPIPPSNLISLRVNGGNQVPIYPDEFRTDVGSSETFSLQIHTTGYTIQSIKLNLDKYPVSGDVCKPGIVKSGTECLVCNPAGTDYIEDKRICDKLYKSSNLVCTSGGFQGPGHCAVTSCPTTNGWTGSECPVGSTEWSPSGGGTYRYEVCGNGAGTCSLSICAHPPSTSSGLLCWYNGYNDPVAGSNVYQTCYKDATACSAVNPQVPCSFASTYAGTQSDGRTILYQDGTSQDLTGLCDKDRKDCTLTVSVKCSISKFSNPKLLAFQGEVTSKENGPLGSNTVSVKVLPPPG